MSILFWMSPRFHHFLLLLVLLIQSCGGGGVGSGGVVDNSKLTPTPLSVDASSFVNKSAADLDNFVVSKLSKIPLLSANFDGFESIASTLAVADFQRTGQYSAFVVGSNGTSARGYFLKYNSTSGRWEDISADLFYDAASGVHREACTGAEQALVTKFNGDDAPDIYLVCSGTGGVAQYLYLSRADGKYELVKTSAAPMSIRIDAKGASIADINGDGVVDVVTSHQRIAPDPDLLVTVSVMLGTYVRATNTYTLGAPRAIALSGLSQPLPNSIRNVFLLPRSGRFDLLVGGDGGQGSPMAWYQNNGTGFFDNTHSLSYLLTGGDAFSRYDYVESGAHGYVYVTSSQTGALVKLWRITKPDTSANNALYKHTLSEFRFSSPVSTDWASRIIIKNNYIVPYDAGCADNPVHLQIATVDQRCGQTYPLDKFTAN